LGRRRAFVALSGFIFLEGGGIGSKPLTYFDIRGMLVLAEG
jgi:hypothetical protein